MILFRKKTCYYGSPAVNAERLKVFVYGRWLHMS